MWEEKRGYKRVLVFEKTRFSSLIRQILRSIILLSFWSLLIVHSKQESDLWCQWKTNGVIQEMLTPLIPSCCALCLTKYLEKGLFVFLPKGERLRVKKSFFDSKSLFCCRYSIQKMIYQTNENRKDVGNKEEDFLSRSLGKEKRNRVKERLL